MNSELKFYEVDVKYTDIVDAKQKKFSEKYLVNGVSVTDVETTVTSLFSTEFPGVEFEVNVVKASKIVRVI